ncbi:SNARE-complex protein Syntaxin-18 N-terminus [Geosmithia morbida]|uniref:SNARE-complex protein Syntaxin-18 N-terminus n=1 Tax=Geosmithia morbida TaxID=1094350 RepID=A0A9P4Z3E0_9HYPO|nr:SNARE-complex protein Syntaxin-18 N-terminus [Geosmithia morbida]KAF4126699.1 SNARE-complex protein Syntaxin-18 N-terminus [Geosmithia morbida]
MDITPDFDELLKQRGAPTTTTKQVSLDRVDGFLKEALRINSHITRLHQSLRNVRRAYLARAQPRKGHVHPSTDGQPQLVVLSDRDREAVDRDAKDMMRELNWSIEALDGAEKVRHETETKAIQKKYGSSLGALGSWAAGASGALTGGKSPEYLAAEEQANGVKTHRDGVLWYLRQQLQMCGQTQKAMMEARLTREIEMNRSLGSQAALNMADFADFAPPAPSKSTAAAAAAEAQDPQTPSYRSSDDQGLSREQIQMFEEGNQDMMKYFESMNESVQTAQRSLAEISDLQSTLIVHLATQTEQIDVLVAESHSTTENVEGGNRQLKKATSRPSAARLTFYATSGLCAFLVAWDLLF